MDKRFEADEYTALDRKTGLVWCRDADIGEFPMTWKEAFGFVERMGRECYGGYGDWRLPNRRELFSLASHDHVNPSLPERHPFWGVFPGYYWSASTCVRLPDQAWYVHFGGAKVYRGMKHAANMVWPVRTGGSDRGVYRTGQTRCWDEAGRDAACVDHPLQHMAVLAGRPWPSPRFETANDVVTDRLTGLCWTRKAGRGDGFLSWQEGLGEIGKMNREHAFGHNDWRMPSIRELESLADLGTHSPALPESHPFEDVGSFYWSGTISMYENRYAWAYYAKDGAVGVGFRENPEFALWPVRGEISV